jgi:hypothetical protein
MQATVGKRGLASSSSSVSTTKPAGGIEDDDRCTDSVTGIVTVKPMKANGSDASDAHDAKSPTLSDRNPVPSDINDAREEPRSQREFTAQLFPPMRQPKHRERPRLKASADVEPIAKRGAP